MKSGRTVSANKCKDVCAVFGSVDCKTVSMDTDVVDNADVEEFE